MLDYMDLLIRFTLNLVAIVTLAYLIHYRRYKNRESLTLFSIFNLLLFPFLNIDFQLGSQFGFALFAILAVIRIRSDTFSKREMAYFFGCIALAVINGIGMDSQLLLVLSNIVILLAAYIADHPQLLPEQEMEKTRLLISNMEPALLANRPALIRELSAHFNLPVSDVIVRRIDLKRNLAEIDLFYPKLATTVEKEIPKPEKFHSDRNGMVVETVDPTVSPS